MLTLDLSISETGICINGETKSVKTPAKWNNYKRIDEILHNIYQVIDNFDFDYVGVERYSYNVPNPKILTQLAELAGCVKHCLWQEKINPVLISPTQWKAMVLGESHIKKNRIQLLTYKRFDKEVNNDNEADAFCMHKFLELTEEYLKKQNFEYKYHENSIKKLAFRLIKDTDMVKKKGKKYYYDDKKVASFNGLSRYVNDDKKIYEEAYKKFKELYKIN